MQEYNETYKEKIHNDEKQYRELNKDKICEYGKEHYNLHREEIINKAKIYQELNKEAIKEKADKQCICICGGKYVHQKKNRHINSKSIYYILLRL